MDSFASALMTLRAEQPPAAEALYALYVEHADSLHATLARLAPVSDADDLLHDVFLIAVRRLDTLLNADSRRAWLHGVALKVARAHRRRQALRKLLSLSFALEIAGDDDVHRQLEWKDRSRLAAAALATLSPKKREVFVLFELQGLEGHEIAAALGCPLKTVWSRLAHARREFLAAVARLEGSER